MKSGKLESKSKSQRSNSLVRVIAFPGKKRTEQNKLVPICALQKGGEAAQLLVESIRSKQVLPPRVVVTNPARGTDLGRFLKTLPPANNDKGRFDIIDVNFGSPWSSDRGEELQIILSRDLLRRNGFLSVTFTTARSVPRTAKGREDFLVGSVFGAATDSEGNLIPEGLALKIMNLAQDSGQRLRFCRIAQYADTEGNFDFLFQRIA